MAINMGIGLLGDRRIIIKRKFRWTLRIEGICNGKFIVPDSFLVSASRPNLDIDEQQIDYLNATTWIPGKGRWQTMEVTYLDVAIPAGVSAPERGGQPINIYNWLASVYDFSNPTALKMGSNRLDYAGTGILVLYDGCGNPLEQWILNDLWPKAVNWGDLSMDSNEAATIQLTLRYSSVDYTSFCPRGKPQSCCTGCLTN